MGRPDLAGKHVVASLSGGKDSAAMCLWLQEQGIPFEAVFMNTGWEHPDTLAYIDEVLEPRFGPIKRLRGDLDMVGLIRRKGMFPTRQKRFCTQQLKLAPFIAHLDQHSVPRASIVNCVGIRAGESAARSRMVAWEWDADLGGLHVWRSLLTWSEQDVIDMHHRHDLPPNPLYLRGASRVGCWPCINARKSEIKHIAETDQGRIDQIRTLETEITAAADARALAFINDALDGLGRDVWLAALALSQVQPRLDRVTQVVEGIEVRGVEWKGVAPACIALDWSNPDWLFARQQCEVMPGAAPVGEALISALAQLVERDLVEVRDGTYRVARRLAGYIMCGPRTFFQAKHGARYSTGGRANFQPIDDVVSWSQTAHGGRQFELFHEESQAGCMRWGMCDQGGG